MNPWDIPEEHPMPPGNHLKQAGLHWLKEYDYDKRFVGYALLQWQPGVKEWCKPGEHLTGNAVKLTNRFVYVTPCAAPLEPNEVDSLRRLIQSVKYESEGEAVVLRVSKNDWRAVNCVLHQLIP